MKTENKLICGTMFAFGVSGAGCLALGSLIPFFREAYALSYDFAGTLILLINVAVMVLYTFDEMERCWFPKAS